MCSLACFGTHLTILPSLAYFPVPLPLNRDSPRNLLQFIFCHPLSKLCPVKIETILTIQDTPSEPPESIQRPLATMPYYLKCLAGTIP